MSEVKSFAQLKQIGANQQTTIKQQQEILANQHKDLQMKKQSLEMEKVVFQQEKFDAIRHQVNQNVDFAIRSLPWWNRGTKAIVNRATELLFAIQKETAKHVAMGVLAEKINEEAKHIDEIKAETEEKLDEIISE